MIFNVVNASLLDPRVHIRPAVATNSSSSKYPLQTLPVIQTQNPSLKNAIAGVNGGYFWRLDSESFFDGVCIIKTRWDAEQPVDPYQVNHGISDSLVIIDGEYKGCNCDKYSYNVPVALIANGTKSKIRIMERGGTFNNEVQNAIAAGPNLVSFDGQKPFFNIPYDDVNINIWEHSSNTAIGLVRDSTKDYYQVSNVLLVTADGSDGCSDDDPTCGIEAWPMGYFMKDFLGSDYAVEMDQGGSTTMWVKGYGVVSNPGQGARSIYSGLFVTYE